MTIDGSDRDSTSGRTVAGPAKRDWRPRVSLAAMLWITLGIGIGFAPLKLWELSQPKAELVQIKMELIEVPIGAINTVLPPHTNPVVDSVLADQISRAAGQMKRATVLSRPMVSTVPGSAATIVVGQQMPFTQTSSSGKTQVDYIETGLEFQLIPTILRNGRVAIEMKSSMSEAVVNPTGPPSLRSKSFASEAELGPDDCYWFVAPSSKPGFDIVVISRVKVVR